MKKPTEKSHRRGFTLIELLVVIAIIAVLAAAGFAAGTAAMNKAKRLTGQNIASSVSLAVNNFYSDESSLPDPGTTSTDSEFNTKPGSSGVKLLEILAGIDTGDQNSKKVRYLNVSEAKNGRGGIEYSTDGKTIRGMFDAFGQPFYIMLDYDYDERLTVRPQNCPQSILNGKRVAVYSLGVPNPADAKANTLSKSW